MTGVYDNGLNNIAPTLITMTADVQEELLKTCNMELASSLHFQLPDENGHKVPFCFLHFVVV